MRDMTHSCAIFWLCKYDLTQYILQVALVYTSCEFIRAPWRIHMILVCMWLMTPIYVLYSAFVYTPCELICVHDLCICDLFVCDAWSFHMCFVFCICVYTPCEIMFVPWSIHMWRMTNTYVFYRPHVCKQHTNSKDMTRRLRIGYLSPGCVHALRFVF